MIRSTRRRIAARKRARITRAVFYALACPLAAAGMIAAPLLGMALAGVDVFNTPLVADGTATINSLLAAL